MLGVLFPFGWWIPLLLVTGTLPAFAALLQMTLKQHNWRVFCLGFLPSGLSFGMNTQSLTGLRIIQA